MWGSSTTRLSLAYRDLDEVPASLITGKAATALLELDLSNNRLTEVAFARGLTALETLVLDGNKLTHQVRFPPLPRLQTLWVNRNQIAILPTFLDRLAEALPRLRFLSMLGNQACPNYLNGGTLKQYKDYRLFVISRLRQLEMLDDAPVTEEERQEATRIYGSLDVSGAEAMYKQQTLDKGTTEAEEQKREAAAKEEEAPGSARRRKDGSRKKAAGTTKTPTKKKAAPKAGSTTPAASPAPASAPATPVAKPEERPPATPAEPKSSQASPVKKTPAKQNAAPPQPRSPLDDLPEVNQAAFGIAGLPPSAIALPSLAKKSMPPPPPRDDAEEDGDDEEEEEEENGAAAYVDDLPDPLDDTPQLPAVNAKRGRPSGGRGALPPPPPKLGGGDDEEEDESDWTEDDSEDEREVLALDVDLPDFSNEP